MPEGSSRFPLIRSPGNLRYRETGEEALLRKTGRPFHGVRISGISVRNEREFVITTKLQQHLRQRKGGYLEKAAGFPVPSDGMALFRTVPVRAAAVTRTEAFASCRTAPPAPVHILFCRAAFQKIPTKTGTEWLCLSCYFYALYAPRLKVISGDIEGAHGPDRSRKAALPRGRRRETCAPSFYGMIMI